MAGLKGGVLAVVREAEELARELGEAGALAVHPAQDTPDEDGRRGAAALGGEGSESVAIPDGAALGVAAPKAEAELAGEEPGRRAAAEPAGRGDVDALGPRGPVVASEAGIPGRVVLEPGVGVVLVAIREREAGVARVKSEEAEALAVVVGDLVVVLARVVSVVRGSGPGIVDVSREERALAPFALQTDRVVLVPALAAEVNGVEPLLRIGRKKLLALDGDGASRRRLEGGEGVAGARDELVELEDEEALRARVCDAGALRLRHVRDEE